MLRRPSLVPAAKLRTLGSYVERYAQLALDFAEAAGHTIIAPSVQSDVRTSAGCLPRARKLNKLYLGTNKWFPCALPTSLGLQAIPAQTLS